MEARKEALLGRNSSTEQTEEEAKLVKWCKTSSGWVKLNSKERRNPSDGMAYCGAVIRSSDGRWLGGFSKHIRVCTMAEAEIWGVFIGLSHAWEKGFRKVEVMLDCKEAVRLLQD
ncbi:hypothetical protein F3Y22_tig00110306pilonHSYRG00049 [Hibiscus syriacus]|uniref:RNase H type-1 domain-containing protein n=1 Tax=Hibiscus syriacus TaxID=106335 RepID=A0A6A3B580_HIBSY|nr:hypothetical protein F3Y22_tig00110306pilonHSYRG00049 [Hibiscus syriacus]